MTSATDETSTPSGPPKAPARTVQFKIRRQDGPDKPETRRWEEFHVEHSARLTVVGALRQIQERPVNSRGEAVTPVAWDGACLADVCGACTLLVNGRVRQGCSALVDAVAPKKGPIVLEPLRKFPVIRDLVVDRSRIFDALKSVRAWRELDAGLEHEQLEREAPESAALRYQLGGCSSCGACLEACPEYGPRSDFVGAAAINQVRLHNGHPRATGERRARLQTVMGPGGVADCGKAQNCVEVCPAQIPLVDSIQEVAGDTTRELVQNWLFR